MAEKISKLAKLFLHNPSPPKTSISEACDHDLYTFKQDNTIYAFDKQQKLGPFTLKLCSFQKLCSLTFAPLCLRCTEQKLCSLECFEQCISVYTCLLRIEFEINDRKAGLSFQCIVSKESYAHLNTSTHRGVHILLTISGL